MLYRFLLTTLCIIESCALLKGQDTTDFRPKLELGMNITQTLSGFFNASSTAQGLDPYLFSMKLGVSNRMIWRIGANVRFQNREEFQNTGQRLIEDRSIDLRFGFEFRKVLLKRFLLNYGLDAAWRQYTNTVDFQFAGGSLTTGSSSSGYGGGPFLGVLYKLGPRVMLGTEGAAYFFYTTGNTRNQVDPQFPPPVTRIRSVDFRPYVPNSLYLFFRI
jgi:hypothetical protein